MKNIIDHLRSVVMAGIIFLVPVFVIVLIIQKLFTFLRGFGVQLASMLGIKTVAGVGAATVGTTMLLIVIFYTCGLLVRFTLFTSLRNSLENKVLMYIPGYLNYKVKMEEKLMPKVEQRIAAIVRSGDVERPGFLVHRHMGKCTVFIPNTPDTDAGQVWLVDESQVREIGIADKVFLDGIRHSGKGLKM